MKPITRQLVTMACGHTEEQTSRKCGAAAQAFFIEIGRIPCGACIAADNEAAIARGDLASQPESTEDQVIQQIETDGWESLEE